MSRFRPGPSKKGKLSPYQAAKSFLPTSASACRVAQANWAYRQFAFFINPRYAIPGLCSVRDVGKPSGTAVDSKATPRNDMKKPHHLPISANCGGESAYFRCMGKLNQAGKQRLSARIRFASANNIFNFAVCFRRPRYRVFRYRNRPFTTPKTCSTFARTDDFSCSLRFN